MINRHLQWRRNNEGDLKLWVNDGEVWKYYKNHPFYRADHATSSHSGFATAQRLLGVGYTFLPTPKETK